MKHAIVLLIFQLIPLFSFGASSSSVEAKLVYLSHLHVMNKLYLDSNLEYLRTLRTCLDLKLNGDANSITSATLVIQKFINLDGDVRETKEICNQFVARWLKTLAREYKTMRKSLVLSSTSHRSENILLSHTVDADIRYKMNFTPRHKTALSLTDSLRFAELPNVDEAQALTYGAVLDRHTAEKCQEFAENRELKRRFPGVDVCDYLIFRDWSKKVDLGFDQEQALRTERNHFLMWHSHQLEIFREERRAEYDTTANLNPVLLYLTSTHPSWKELTAAVDSVIQNHEKFVAKSGVETLKNVRLAFSFSEARALGKIEAGKTISRLESVLKKQRFEKDISGYLNKLDPTYSFDAVIAETQGQWQSENSRNEMIIMGLVIGANTMCLLPWGKIVSLTAKALIKSSCFVGVGIGLNTFLVLSFRHQYEASMERLLMATTSRYARGKLSEADEKRSAFLGAALLWPIGLIP